MKLHGKHQRLVYANDVSMLGGIIHVLKRSPDTSVVASKENGLDVNANNYMVISRDQNAGQSHSIKFDNSSIERVKEFRYLGTTLTNQNSIQEEINAD